MCLDVGLFGFILFGTPWTSWIWMPVSFPRVENFSTLIFSNKYSAHYSLLFLEPITCESWPAWWCSISFLSYLHFPFWSFLLFTALIGWVTLPCLWGHWFLLHLFCCLNHLFYFSVPLLLFSSLWTKRDYLQIYRKYKKVPNRNHTTEEYRSKNFDRAVAQKTRSSGRKDQQICSQGSGILPIRGPSSRCYLISSTMGHWQVLAQHQLLGATKN